ncbi:MAG: hypothetical protein IJI09_08545 [Clostridia bacterium]|nr:hypothetical protein [Clostridia bacterium]
MRRNNKGGRLLAALLVLIMLLCSFPMVYAADTAAVNTVADREYNPETGMESVMIAAEPAATPETDPADVPEEESAETSEPADIPEEDPAAEPAPAEVPEEEPAAEVDPAEISEEETEKDSEPEAEPETEEEPEADTDEKTSEDALYEFDDDEVGSVSGELLEIFKSPDTYERIEFTGTVDIELKNSEICYDRDVTLVARVSGTDMDYRLVWEANDGSGWFAVASGDEYTFLLTPDIVNREYRVVLFRVC